MSGIQSQRGAYSQEYHPVASGVSHWWAFLLSPGIFFSATLLESTWANHFKYFMHCFAFRRSGAEGSALSCFIEGFPCHRGSLWRGSVLLLLLGGAQCGFVWHLRRPMGSVRVPEFRVDRHSSSTAGEAHAPQGRRGTTLRPSGSRLALKPGDAVGVPTQSSP
ncbi:hypothetical protein DQ04_00681200 [Trypanosoma grayi]|uniref:hypothetical protein n=1 Tax=Trypanosoma grayi TaxID=71804 RepID=UPI0004F41CEA|nr:hypothetical protein DQ04_00681200 [Trypanosoma grayi]KEG13996.1 hypothetical protein DQ04_00681200 [Trypanosoma grayi]